MAVFLLVLFPQMALAFEQQLVLTLQHRPAQEIVPWIAPMVGESGSVTAQDGQLFVSASPARLAQIKAVVEQLDAPYKNLEITIKRSAGALVRRDTAVVANGAPADPVAAQVDNAHPDGSTQNAAAGEVLPAVENEQTFVRVVGEVPLTRHWEMLLQQYLDGEVDTALQEMDLGFAIRPRVVGSMLELHIAPMVAAADGDKMIDFAELGSVVRASPGEWLDLIHNMRQRDAISRAIIASYQALDGPDAVLEIKVE